MAFIAVRSPQHVAAQSGTVTYTHTAALNTEFSPEMDQFPGMEQFKDMIPSSVTNAYVLDFNETLSSMRLLEEEEEGTKNPGNKTPSVDRAIKMMISFFPGSSDSGGSGPQ